MRDSGLDGADKRAFRPRPDGGSNEQHEQNDRNEQAPGGRHQVAEVLRAIREALGAAGFDATQSRVVGVFRVSGSLVDALFGDVLLGQGGLLVVVEPQMSCKSGAHQLHRAAERWGLGMPARRIVVTCEKGLESDLTVWIV